MYQSEPQSLGSYSLPRRESDRRVVTYVASRYPGAGHIQPVKASRIICSLRRTEFLPAHGVFRILHRSALFLLDAMLLQLQGPASSKDVLAYTPRTVEIQNKQTPENCACAATTAST